MLQLHAHSKSWASQSCFWMQHHCCPQGKEHPPILLVDGYNVLFNFVESLQLNHHSHPIESAKTFDGRRQAFELSIDAYSHARGVKVVIAYDAMNRSADPVHVDIRTSSRYEMCCAQLAFCKWLPTTQMLCKQHCMQQHYQAISAMETQLPGQGADGSTAGTLDSYIMQAGQDLVLAVLIVYCSAYLDFLGPRI